MIALLVGGTALLLIGAAIAGWALWRVSKLDVGGPACAAGPYVQPFTYGCAIALTGAFFLIGFLWRLAL